MRALQIIALCAAVLAAVEPAAAQDATLSGDAPLPFDAVPVEANTSMGGITFSPTFVVIENGETAGQINLYNTGAYPVRIRVDGFDLAVDELRNYSEVPDGEVPDWSLMPYLRFAPRQVTLRPGERQVIKLIARLPADQQADEYRSHLRMTFDPVTQPSVTSQDAESETDIPTISATTELRYRVTLPVILRTGEAMGATRVAAAEPASDDPSKLVVTLEREGPHGQFGVVQALAEDGRRIAEVAGVSVLVPNLRRVVTLGLPEGAPPVARVVFAEQLSRARAGDVISSLDLE